jgi:hypothetical protein
VSADERDAERATSLAGRRGSARPEWPRRKRFGFRRVKNAKNND